MARHSLLLFFLSFTAFQLFSQNVNVTATLGTGSATYANLSDAFTAINSAIHKGVITVTVVNNTSEGPFGAILQFSGYASLTDYTRVTITTNGNWTVSGSPAPGQSVIQINRARNVIMNGTINNGTNGTRALTISNISNSTNTGAIWLKSAGWQMGCSRDTIKNLNIIGGTASGNSTFGIYVAGSSITPTGAGADNDSTLISNNQISRCGTGIYYHCNNTGQGSNVTISKNVIGSALSTHYVVYRGINIQYLNNSLISENEIYNINQSSAYHVTGIEVGANVSTTTLSRNHIHDLLNTNTSYYGAYGISMNGTGNTIVNSQIYNIRGGSNSISSTAFNSFGIKLTGGSGHKLYHNSVHMTGAVPLTGSNPGMTSALCISVSPLSGLDIQNNIFSNQMTGSFANSRFYTVFVPNGYSFLGSIIDHNAYFVPPANTANSQYFIGSNLGFNHQNLAAWKGYTQQDSSSVPSTNQVAPFISATNLHINTSIVPVIVESGGLYLPNHTLDYDNEPRFGHPSYSHNPPGVAPDIGMDEIAAQAPDIWGPLVDSLYILPAAGLCTAAAHQVQAVITDSSGVDTAVIRWSLNGVAQTDLGMVDLGTFWAGVIPPQPGGYVTYYIVAIDGSANANQSLSNLFGYQDEYLSASAGPDVIICPGDTATLSGSTQFDGTPKITEVTMDRTGLGATPSYPAYAGGADLIEITNLGNVPVDLAGYTLKVGGGATASITFSSPTVVPDSGILIIHIGSGIDDPANLYFNTGGFSNDLQSGEATGVWLKAPNGRIVDAVGINGYTFIAGTTGVLASDWSGNMGPASGAAGVSRNGPDSNTPTGWVVSAASPVQSMGSHNSGVPFNTSIAFYWSPGAITQSTIRVNPTGPTQYVFNVLDGTCTQTDTVVVDVQPVPLMPTTISDTICGFDTLHLEALGAPTMRWYNSQTGQTVINVGPTFTLVASNTTIFWVESFNGGCSGPRAPVNAVVNPAPLITLVSSDTTICRHDTITFIASSLNAAYQYNWTGSGLLQTTGDTIQVVPQTTGYIAVDARDTVCINFDSINIIVNPVPNVSLQSSDTLICIDDTVTLNSTISQAFTRTVYFADSTLVPIPDNNASGGLSTIVVSSLNDTVINDSTIAYVCLNITHPRDGDISAYLISPAGDSIRLFANLGGNVANYYSTCFSSLSPTNIYWGNAPYAGFWFPQGPGTLSSFNGTNPNGVWGLRVIDALAGNVGSIIDWSITFNDINPVSYSWSSLPIGFSASNSNPIATPVIDTRYYLTVTDTVTGCFTVADTLIQVADSLNANPSGPPGICLNGTDTIFAFALGGDRNYTFTWNPGSVQNDSLFLTMTADTTLYLTVQDACGSPPHTDSIFIPVALPVSATTNNDTTICPGTAVYLLSNISGGDGNFIYSWSSGGNYVNEVVLPVAPLWVSLLVSDGCSSSDSDSVYIDLFAMPTLSAPPDTTICEGASITLTPTYTANALPVSFQWNPIPDTTLSVTVSPTAYTFYRISMVDACGSNDVDSVKVFIDPKPIASFNSSALGAVVTYTNTSTFATTYFWNFGDTQNSTQTSPQHTYTASGNYTVSLIATNDCGSDTMARIINVVVVGIEAGLHNTPISVWPNPNLGDFNIEFSGKMGESFSLALFNLQGIKVWESTGQCTKEIEAVEIEIPAISKGIYMLELEMNSRLSRTNVIIH